MSRLKFDSNGKLFSVDQKLVSFAQPKPTQNQQLKTSSELEFLKESPNLENIFDHQYWSLYENNSQLKPLEFSNGKTQEDIVKEIVDCVKAGKKVIFLHGMCGTGKSAIALNLARSLGTTAIVVPVKALQRQYEEDYMGKKYLIKQNGQKMKIAMITGRENHDSILFPGRSCADPSLPDTIKIAEKNHVKIKQYYQDNPFISSAVMPPVKSLRRISIAPANPYWSPIAPTEIELNQLQDATKKTYTAINNRQFIFYHRKHGCSYYDQYCAYLDADAIIFNAAKYLTEIASGKKPLTEVDIIDEADEFLDSLSNSMTVNLTRLASALNTFVPESSRAQFSIRKVLDLINAEEKNKKALGINENKVYHLDETKIGEILQIFLRDIELQVEIELDEFNYANIALEIAQAFEDTFNDVYLTFRKDEEDFLYATLVTTNLARKFKQIVDANKVLVLMSGTLHSESVLRNIFGIEDFATVEAETIAPGTIEVDRTGKEFDCRYSHFQKRKHSREEYLKALSQTVARAQKPGVIHVNAFTDLPTKEEKDLLQLHNLIPSQILRELQSNDKTGSLISIFKSGLSDVLFTTKCSRGIDFPGDTCRSVIFTKYPNPDVKDTFWKILHKTHPTYYWEFYRDKARREFLQRIYRALRSREDHVFVLSPDSRVLDAARDLQENTL